MPFFPHPEPHGSPMEIFAGALGVTAAILMIGGALLLRGQRNRQKFLLMQSALEKGITFFPGQPPFWLLSLRQGITTMTLGLALLIVGGGAWSIGDSVAEPTAALAAEAPPSFQNPPAPNQTPPPPQTPPQNQAEDQRPENRPGGPDEHRPPRNPLIERWQRAQMEITLGQIALGCGVILLMLGLARTAFARTERRYAMAAPVVNGPAAPPV